MNALRESIEKQIDVTKRLHPEVSNPATVEILRRQLIMMSEAYLELLKLYMEERS